MNQFVGKAEEITSVLKTIAYTCKQFDPTAFAVKCNTQYNVGHYVARYTAWRAATDTPRHNEIYSRLQE